MKRYITYTFSLLFFVLLLVNVFIFVSSIRLSEEINQYEKNTAKLKQKNEDLENQIYRIDSLQHARFVAPQMNFTVVSSPLYLNGLNYALKP